MALNKFRRNVYSQNDEDGVIEEICLRLGIKIGAFVEFGAWDGNHLSRLKEWHIWEILTEAKRSTKPFFDCGAKAAV